MTFEDYELTVEEAGEIAAMKVMLSDENEEEIIILEDMELRTLKSPVPEGVYSVFIPWAETWVGEEKVRKELGECGWGEIKKVDFVKSDQKRKHWKVYIHFTSLPEEVKLHLDNGNHVKVYYNGTYYWKVFKSKYVHLTESKYELSN